MAWSPPFVMAFLVKLPPTPLPQCRFLCHGHADYGVYFCTRNTFRACFLFYAFVCNRKTYHLFRSLFCNVRRGARAKLSTSSSVSSVSTVTSQASVSSTRSTQSALTAIR
ncbi:hypothetical protein MRX96_000594 [Rhipicephalus microplus]